MARFVWGACVLAIGGCGGVTHETNDASPAHPLASNDAPPDAHVASCPTRPDRLSADAAARVACGGNCDVAPCTGGPCRPEVFAVDAATPVVLAVDAQYLYWASLDHVIRRQALAGGAAEDVVTIDGFPKGLARQGSRIFWSSTSTVDGFEGGTIASTTLPPGPSVVLHSGGVPHGIAATVARVYWADFGAGVYSVGHADGTATGAPEFFAGYDNATGLCLHAGTVFWTQENQDNSIRFRDTSGSAAPSLIACNQEWPLSVVADDVHIFWMSEYIRAAFGQVMIIDRAGGEPKVLVPNLADPAMRSLTGDDSALYWVELGTNIMRMAK